MPIRRRQKKRNAGPRQKQKQPHAVINPLVNPGNPPHRHQTRPKADPTRTHHRMVTVAQTSPSSRSALSPQKTATVMLDGYCDERTYGSARRPSSVDPLTRDLPGPRIEHQSRRLAGAILQKGKAGMVATVHEELAVRQGDDRGGGALLKIKHRQSSACLDRELAILDGDLKIGPGACRSDQSAGDRQFDGRDLPVARDPQPDLAVNGPAHLFKRLVEGHALR